MKIKSDFITNSSTCNFILLGFEIEIKDCGIVEALQALFPDKSDDEIHDMAEDDYMNWHIMCGTEMGATSNKHALVGDLLHEFDCEGEEVEKIELGKLKEAQEDLSQKFGAGRDYKLIFGTRMC